MISVAELLLTAVVAIIVLGPERLPKVAYELGRFVQRLNRLWIPLKQAFHAQQQNFELERNQQRASAAEKANQSDE